MYFDLLSAPDLRVDWLVFMLTFDCETKEWTTHDPKLLMQIKMLQKNVTLLKPFVIIHIKCIFLQDF